MGRDGKNPEPFFLRPPQGGEKVVQVREYAQQGGIRRHDGLVSPFPEPRGQVFFDLEMEIDGRNLAKRRKRNMNRQKDATVRLSSTSGGVEPQLWGENPGTWNR